MIVIIQFAVVLIAIVLVVAMLLVKQTHAARAWKKIALSLLACAMIVAAVFPDITNRAAHLVGVGRGADLLLYVSVLAFIVYVLNNYLHQQRDKDAMYRLARKVALLDAFERYGINKD